MTGAREPAGAVFGAIRGAADTIAAIATAPGRGAIALVRMSGPGAADIAARVVTPWPTEPRVATLCAVRDPLRGTLADRALVTRFEEGRSFTGESLVEISTHGGAVAPVLVLAALLGAGARIAERGEFTRRAVINGVLDLAQAEAIGDVVDATSRAAHRVALETLDGGLSRRMSSLREAVLEIEALIAYDIDFPEEDDGPVAPARIREATIRALDGIDRLIATAPAGELVRHGAVVVIAGLPNAGKSSLFNALVGEARALVTPMPGTTRDAIEAVIDGARWPLRLVDTAGLRDTTDVIERLGIEVSERYLAGAEVVLLCGESTADLDAVDARVGALTRGARLRVFTKADRTPHATDDCRGTIATSAETGAGLTAVLDAIDGAIAGRHGEPAIDAPILTRVRHVAALRRARGDLAAFLTAWTERALPAPVAAVHLRSAVTTLEEVVGVVGIEDVLDRVFHSFCVGK